MKRITHFTLLAATLIALLRLPTQAGPIAYVRDAPTGPSIFAVDGGGNPIGTFGAGTINGNLALAALLALEISFDDPNAPYTAFMTYCADPFLSINVPTSAQPGAPFDVISLETYGLNATSATAIRRLWANAFVESTQDATRASAFQYIVWEYIGDVNQSNPFDLAAGNIRVTDGDIQAQIAIWNALIPTWTTSSDLLVLDGRAAERQSLFYDATVPEPSTYALMGAGLAALFLRRRFKR